jgi:hypothetical protein
MSLSIPDYGVKMECGNKPPLGEFKIQNSKNGFLILRV